MIKKFKELKRKKGYFIDDLGTIEECYIEDAKPKVCKNVLTNKEDAEGVLALIQLIELKNFYNDNCELDFTNENVKYVITNHNNTIVTTVTTTSNAILAFKEKEKRDKFLIHFSKLINKAKKFI